VITRDWGSAWEEEDYESRAFSAWGSPELGRTAHYMYARREGCDPWDFYVRFIEQGVHLYRIELQAYPGSSYAQVRPWLEAFFDAPFGPPPPAGFERLRLAAERSTVPQGPC
jgi:hypothetical protein